ncbi:hypothetical protein [Dyadobacter bucti]|uniref:hypothetical protein n=1 Tax=Dyadobacter bucti TaxID=2572203 RepID=UPI003F702125
MLKVTGIYSDGTVKLDKDVKLDGPVKILVTFLDDASTVQLEPAPSDKLQLSDFSFQNSRELLRNLKVSLSGTVVEERRSLL